MQYKTLSTPYVNPIIDVAHVIANKIHIYIESLVLYLGKEYF